jgi:hypothetical protein
MSMTTSVTQAKAVATGPPRAATRLARHGDLITRWSGRGKCQIWAFWGQRRSEHYLHRFQHLSYTEERPWNKRIEEERARGKKNPYRRLRELLRHGGHARSGPGTTLRTFWIKRLGGLGRGGEQKISTRVGTNPRIWKETHLCAQSSWEFFCGDLTISPLLFARIDAFLAWFLWAVLLGSFYATSSILLFLSCLGRVTWSCCSRHVRFVASGPTSRGCMMLLMVFGFVVSMTCLFHSSIRWARGWVMCIYLVKETNMIRIRWMRSRGKQSRTHIIKRMR